MNTLDLVKQHGGEPANFLDIGGGANAERVRNALEMVLLDPKVRGVFINIFGGITRGDEVARGIIAARDQLRHHQAIGRPHDGDHGRGGTAVAPGGRHRPGQERQRSGREHRRTDQREQRMNCVAHGVGRA